MRTNHVIMLLLATLLLSACGVTRAPGTRTPIRRMGEAEMFAGNPQAQALAKAAVKGDIREIDRLVDAGADPNAVGLYGMTVPGWLLYHPNKAGFRRLLERGADPNKIWYNGTSPQTSLLHEATYRSPILGTDYLKMCLEIGKGNPNLLPPDKHYRPINFAVNAMCHDAFILLYNAGSDLDFHSDTGLGRNTLVQAAAQTENFELTYFLLQRGSDYTYSGKTGLRNVKDVIDYNFVYTRKYATDPRDPQYMWFWRCVDWLEKRGMTFDIMSAKDKDYAVRPAVLDTTPPSILTPLAAKQTVPAAKAVAPPKNINMLMHQVNLTFPLPVWADTPETRENVTARQTQKPGIITLDYLPKGQTENDWKTFYTASTAYTPGTSLDETLRLVQKTLRTGFGSEATITSEESAPNHHILRFAIADASHTEGVLYIGRFMDTIVTVRAIWRNVDAATASAYRAKALAGMRQIVMKKGLTVLPAN